MIEEIDEIIKEEILVKNNKKVKEETLEEYLSGITKDELARLAFFQAFADQDYEDIFKIKNLKKMSKKDIINYITDNLDKILKCFIKVMSENCLIQLKKIISKQNDINYDMSKLNLSFHTLGFLKSFSLAKVEFNKQTEVLKIYFPKEFVTILEKCLTDVNILDENRKFNKVCDYVESTLEIYGIIPLSQIHEIFERQLLKIELEQLEHIIEIKNIIDDVFVLCNYENDKLICEMDFTDKDDAINFYEKQKGNYKKYGKKTLEMIKNDTYVETLKSYKKFVNYLCRNFDDVSEDIEEIKNFIVLDYINSAQISKEIADINFKNNIDKMFDIPENEKEKLRMLVSDIYDEYPKWRKRGNV